MSTSAIAKNYPAWQAGIKRHNAECQSPPWGIGMSFFDMNRLDLDEGEQLLPGIVAQCDDGAPECFRVLCDGQHAEPEAEVDDQETAPAVADDRDLVAA